MALPAGFERATRAMFKSKLVEASDNIRAKLDTARQEHSALRARLPSVALAAEIGEEVGLDGRDGRSWPRSSAEEQRGAS